jgi:hypothetical protein
MLIHGKFRGSWMTRMKWNEAQPPEELTDAPKEALGLVTNVASDMCTMS